MNTACSLQNCMNFGMEHCTIELLLLYRAILNTSAINSRVNITVNFCCQIIYYFLKQKWAMT